MKLKTFFNGNHYLVAMTVQTFPIPNVIDPELILNQRSWTVAEYEAMISAGLLGDEDAVELLYGKIVDKMIPIGVSHSYCLQELAEHIISRYKGAYICRQEQPVAFPLHSMHEPDYVLAKKFKHRYRKRRPTAEDIKLLIEVADSTLGRDRNSKAKLYASYGISEYWIINLIDHQLEAYTEPTTNEGYAKRVNFQRGESMDSPELGIVAVNDFLPRRNWEEE